MLIRFKKYTPFATVPTRSSKEAAGYDLTAISMDITPEYVEYDTGIAIELPMGYAGLLYARSSISKKQLILANGVGLIDSDYRGTLKFRFKYPPDMQVSDRYEVGDRIGQLVIVPIPDIEFKESERLSTSVRAEGGFGSTGE
jgi:dUTP pyrophosphatase